MKDLLLEVQRENPHWYKLHPCPNLQEDRMNVDPEKFACEVKWWLEHAKELKPATVAYLSMCIDDKDHRIDQPKLGLVNLINLISHSLTNFCRGQPMYDPKSDYRQVLVNNSQTLTREDG